jgi:ATP-binding protein involved in chromosome partitioning
MLLGLRTQKPEQENDYLIPLDAFGLKVMSMGFMVAEEAPMVWRGPMVQSALLQMLRDVQWGELDVLVIDMPPGTGDTQLTIAQRVKLAGAVIVSTPQDVALIDTVKGVHMFQKVAVPILGIIENMSYFCCPECGKQSDIFGTHGARDRAAELKVDFLGGIPIDIALRQASDEGRPLVLQPDHPITKAFADISIKVMQRLNGRHGSKPAPLIVIESAA